MTDIVHTGSSRSNAASHAFAMVAIGFTLYLVCYVGLRCTVLESSAKSITRHGITQTTTWCYYGNGDNWQTVWSNRLFYPLIFGEKILFPPSLFE